MPTKEEIVTAIKYYLIEEFDQKFIREEDNYHKDTRIMKIVVCWKYELPTIDVYINSRFSLFGIDASNDPFSMYSTIYVDIISPDFGSLIEEVIEHTKYYYPNGIIIDDIFFKIVR